MQLSVPRMNTHNSQNSQSSQQSYVFITHAFKFFHLEYLH